MKKINRIINHCILGLLFLLGTTNSVSANSLLLEQTSTASIIVDEQLVSVAASTVVPYGTTVQLDFSIHNDSNISTFIGFERKYGFDFLGYYPGVLKIDGRNLDLDEYAAFIGDQGVACGLRSIPIKISLQVKATGSAHGKISGDLRVSSKEIYSGMNPSRTEHTFPGVYSFPSNYQVSFYGVEKELIQSHSVLENDTVGIPGYEKYGYQLVGFNSQRDGSGYYYFGEKIVSTQKFYAVLEKKQFNVNYYIGDSLVATQKVLYQEEAPMVQVPDKKGKKFLKWDKDLSNITKDVDVYAVYEGDYKKLVIVEMKSNGNSMIEKRKTMNIKMASKLAELFEIKESGTITIYREARRLNFKLIGLFMIALLLITKIWKKRK